MKSFLKRLFCKHEYEKIDECLIEGGMNKMYTLKCKKCGKIKIKTL